MVSTLPIKFTTVNIVKLLTQTLACIYSIIHKCTKLYFIISFGLLEDMPGFLYRFLSGAVLSIRTKCDFYLFYDFHMVEF